MICHTTMRLLAATVWHMHLQAELRLPFFPGALQKSEEALESRPALHGFCPWNAGMTKSR